MISPVLRGSFPTYNAKDVIVNGNLVYVADAYGGLKIIDVSNSAVPVLKGNIATSLAFGVTVSGNLAYVADGFGGLKIIDVSNSAVPVLKGSIATSFARGVTVSGNLAYVADGFGGLKIIDVSNSTNPVLEGSITTFYAQGVTVSGNLAYVADDFGGLKIIDVSNSAIPVLEGSITTSYAQGVAVSGNYAYVADGGGGLKIIDVSNSTNPVLKGSITTSNAQGVAVSGNLAYVADGGGGLKIIDVSNSAIPVLEGSITTSYAQGVTVSGNLAYVADEFAGLKIFSLILWQLSGIPNVSKETIDIVMIAQNGLNQSLSQEFTIVTDYFPTTIGVIKDYSVTIGNPLIISVNANNLFNDQDSQDTLTLMPLQIQNMAVGDLCPDSVNVINNMYLKSSIINFGAEDIVISGNLAYVGGDGLEIIDVSNSMNPVLKGRLVTAAASVSISGNFAYVADSWGSLKIIDISNSTNPVLKGSITVSSAQSVTVNGNFAYVADDFGGLKIIDVSNSTNPVLKGSIATSFAYGLTVSGNLVYVADGGGGLKIIDVSNSTNPILKGSIATYGALGVTVNGNFAYVADDYGGLKIIDISNSTNPVLKGSIATSNAYGVTVSGNFAYIADYYSGLKVIDISNSTNPVLRGSIATSCAKGVAVSSNLAYVADSFGGLKIIDLTNYAINIAPTSTQEQGNYRITFAVSDPDGATASTFFTLRVEGAPRLITPISSQNAIIGQTYSYFIPQNTFVDPNNDVITFTSTLINGTALPTFLSFNPYSATFFGIAGDRDKGAYTILILASDRILPPTPANFTLLVHHAPILTNSLANQVANIGSPFIFAIPPGTFNDPDGYTLSYVAAQSNRSPLPAWLNFYATNLTFSGIPQASDKSSMQISVTANDGLGGSTTGAFPLIVEHFPVVSGSVPQNISAGIGIPLSQSLITYFSDPDGDALTFTATKQDGQSLLSWLNFDRVNCILSGTPQAPTEVFPVRIRGTDPSGGYADLLFSLNIENYPELNGAIPTQIANIGKQFAYTILDGVFTDPDGNDLTYNASLSNQSPLPTWLTFVSSNKTFIGTPTVKQTVQISVTANDGLGGTTTGTFPLIVEHFPVVSGSVLQNISAGIGIPLTQSFFSYFSDPDGDALTFTATKQDAQSLLSWMNFDRLNCILSGMPQPPTRTFPVRIRATDPVGGYADLLFNLNVRNYPVFSGTLPSQVANIGSQYAYTLPAGVFTDPDGNDLTYNASLSNQSPLPTWLAFASSNNTLIGTPQSINKGSMQIFVTANDGQGGTATGAFPLTVEHFPIILGTAPSNVPAGIGIPLSQSFFGLFSDPDGDALTFTAAKQDGQSLLSWLNFDRVNCILSGTPQAPTEAFPVRIRGTDPSGGYADLLFSLNIENYPELNGAIPTQIANIGKQFAYTILDGVFTDKDGDVLTYNASLSNQSPLPTWLTFVGSNKTFIGTPATKQTVQISVTASDGKGGTATGTFPLIVEHFPTINGNIRELAAAVGHTFTFTAINDFSSAESNVLYFSAALKNGQDFPSWFRFNKLTCTFSGVPSQNDIDELVIKLTANDLYGGYVDTTVTVKIDYYAKLAAAALIDPTIVSDVAPVVVHPVPIKPATVGTPFSLDISTGIFHDDDDTDDHLTYAADLGEASAWLKFDNKTMVGTPRNIDAYTYRTRTYQIIINATDPAGKSVNHQFSLVLDGNSLTATILNYFFIAVGALGTIYGYIQQKHLIWNILMKQNYVCKPDIELAIGSCDEEQMLHELRLPSGNTVAPIDSIGAAIAKMNDMNCLKRGYYKFLNGLAYLMYTKVKDETYLSNIKSIAITSTKSRGYASKFPDGLRAVFGLPILENIINKIQAKEFPFGNSMYLLNWLFYDMETNRLMVVKGGPKSQDANLEITIQIMAIDSRILEEITLKIVEPVAVAIAEPAGTVAVELVAVNSGKTAKEHGQGSEASELMKPTGDQPRINTPPAVSPATLGDPQRLRDDITRLYGRQAAGNLGLFFAQRPCKSKVGCEVSGIFAEEVQKSGLQIQIKRLEIATALLEGNTLYVGSQLVKTLQAMYDAGKRDYVAKLIGDIVRCGLEEQRLNKKGVSDAHNIVMRQPSQSDLLAFLQSIATERPAQEDGAANAHGFQESRSFVN